MFTLPSIDNTLKSYNRERFGDKINNLCPFAHSKTTAATGIITTPQLLHKVNIKYKQSVSTLVGSDPSPLLFEHHCRQREKNSYPGEKKTFYYKILAVDVHSQTQVLKCSKEKPLATDVVIKQAKQISSPSLPRHHSLPKASAGIVRKVPQHLGPLHAQAGTQNP